MSKYFALLVSVMLVLVLAACGAVVPAATEAPGEGGFDVRKFEGVYEGTWTNQTTGASGPAVITVEANETNKTVDLTLDFGGNYLGLNDPPPFTLTANYDDNGAAVTGSNPVLGNMDITIDTNGNIVGNLTDLVGGKIPSMTYTGTIGGGRLVTEYVVTLEDGTTTTSVLDTTRK